MDKTEISALLGRPLTTVEDTNFDLYLEIANDALEQLLCTSIEEVTEERTFYTREGYSTAFIDIFSNVSEVKVDDSLVDDSTYIPMQWDKFNASWYNSLVFTSKFSCDQKIEVTADWGFPPQSDASSLPVDLQSVLAGLFDQVTKKNKYDGIVQSKQVEDFRISFNTDADLDTIFYDKYGKTISKYSLCDVPNVQHGKVRCGC